MLTPKEIKEKVKVGDFWTYDFETFYDSKISLKKLGNEEYLQAVGDDVYLVAVTGSDGHYWVGDPRSFDWSKIHGQVVAAHNIRFDEDVFLHLQRLGIIPKEIEPAATICTADLSTYYSGQRSLKKAAKYFYNEDVSKEYRNVAKGMHREDFSQPSAEYCVLAPGKESMDSWKTLLTETTNIIDGHNKEQTTPQQQEGYKIAIAEHAWLTVVLAGYEDATMCRRICEDYFPDWPDMEITVSQMTREGGIKGVFIDQKLLNEQILLCEKVQNDSLHRLPWYSTWQASGLKTPTAKRFVNPQCVKDDIPIPASMNKNDEEYKIWLDKYGEQFEWIDAIKKWGNAYKCLTTFETCKRRVREDGTMPFGLLYFGAHTGRWSGTQKYNMHNMLKKYREKGHPLANIDARGIHIPRPGNKFIISDMSQVEPRVKAWMAKDWEFLETCKTVHPYIAGAVKRGVWNIEDGDAEWLHENMPLKYAMFKASELSLQYGAGFKKFITMLGTFGFDPYELLGTDPKVKQIHDFEKSLECMARYPKNHPVIAELHEMKKVNKLKYRLHVCSWVMVKEWRESNPFTTGLWNFLELHFKRAILSEYPWYVLEFSPNPEVDPFVRVSETKSAGSPEFAIRLPSGRDMIYHNIYLTKGGDIRCKTDLYKQGKNAYVNTYGGSLCENCIQALSRDVFAWQIAQLYYEGVPSLWTVHDETIIECLAADVEHVKSRVDYWMTQSPPWMPGLVLGNSSSIEDKYVKG